MALSSSTKSPPLARGLSDTDVPANIDAKTPPASAALPKSGNGDAKAGVAGQPGSLWRLPLSYRSIPGLVIGFDLLLIVVAGLISATAYHELVFGSPGVIERNIAVSIFVALIFVAITRLNDLYTPTQLLLWNVQLNNIIWIWCVTFFLLSGWLFVWKAGDDVSRGAVLSFWSLGLIALILQRAFLRLFFERSLQSGALRGRKAVLISQNRAGTDSKFAYKLRRHGYDMVREFFVGNSSPEGLDAVLADAVGFLRGSDVEEVLLVIDGGDLSKLRHIAEQLHILPLAVTWVADGLTADLVRRPWFEMGTSVAIEMQKPPRSAAELALKRVIDFVLASLALVVLSPMLLLVALAIKIDSKGPVIFWQTRRGFNGQQFKIAKFRSMKVLEDGASVQQAKKRDPRVTRVGAWIRKTSIDEIPQLLNVLRGEMSLVGPRPHAVVHDDQFIKTVEDYAYRHHVKPGITGWAQVHGYRGETPTLEAIQRRVEFDRWYIANWSLGIDFLIMLRTVTLVVHGRNAY
jgi:putative colanic acid biosynthesis UDP-glucose lipid carrier transferase